MISASTANGRTSVVRDAARTATGADGSTAVNPNPQAPLGARASRPHKAWHARGYLPHFDAGATVQSLTFRLADSLPRAVYDQLVATVADDAERRRRLDAMIDEGRGACLLRVPEFAAIVGDSLQHFDAMRYRLIAWVVMPNHVHVLIEQLEGFRLGDIVRSWKSFTAKEINRRRNASGRVWAPDYFHRFIRDAAHFGNAVRYIEENPVNAGLAAQPEDWPFSSAAN
jgi:REP element-mobilizing transposase RayT